MDFGLDGGECVKVAVAYILEDAPVKRIRATLGNQANLAAGRTTGVSGVGTCVDLEFRYSFC